MSTTELSRPELIALAKEEKQKSCEEEFGHRRRSFVRITGAKGWEGKIGRVRKYVDERTEKHPNIKVEIEVVFTAGLQPTVYAFYPHNLEHSKEPANWGK